MNFRIADTFTGSLAHLGGDAPKAVKTTDLQLNPRRFGAGSRSPDQAMLSALPCTFRLVP